MRLSRAAVAVAIEAMSWIEYEGLSERAAFARAAKQLRVSERDQLRAAQSLILETERRRNFVDFLIQRGLRRQIDFDSLRHGVKSLLRLFCYVAKFQQRGANDHLRILEEGRSVLHWKTLHPVETAFGQILACDPLEASELIYDEALALRLFHPRWFVSACTSMLGRQMALQLMRRNLHQASSYLRINTLRGSEERWLRQVESAGIELDKVEGLPLTYRVLSSRRPIVRSRPYREGGIAIQDKASILAGLVASPKPGDRVFDICAAPGAKTSHLAQQMRNNGIIYSVDRSASRLSFWKDEMSRLGVQIANPIVADAAKSIPACTEGDVVVLDPPCSNTGTFWKSPGAKWTIDRGRIHQIATTQSAMLENASKLVRVGGTLLYSTCTILDEENEYVITRFLRLNPDFQLVRMNPSIGFPGLYGLDVSRRLYPHTHECNGHFICRMMRVS